MLAAVVLFSACADEPGAVAGNGEVYAPTIAALEYALNQWPELGEDSWLAQRVAVDDSILSPPISHIAAYSTAQHPDSVQAWAIARGLQVCPARGSDMCVGRPERGWTLISVSNPAINRAGDRATLLLAISGVDSSNYHAIGYRFEMRRNRQGEWTVERFRHVFSDN